MSIKRLIAGLAATPLVAALAMPLTAFAATTTVVTPTNTQGWSTADTRANGQVSFVADNSAPLGAGALSLITGEATASPSQDKAQFLHEANTPLTNVTNLGYSTKQNSASLAQGDPSYQLLVNLNGTSGFTTFVYEPYQQTAASVTPGIWQNWDVDSGQFWSSRTVTCTNGTGGVQAGGGGTYFYTLAQLKTMCPDAVVTGYGVNVGSNNPNYNTEADALSFNETTYDFEPTLAPKDKDACKNDGWKTFNSPTFKNQGDCVSFVASAKTSNYKLDSAKKEGLTIPTTKGAYYEITVKGTWENRANEVVDAECTNMQSNNWQNAVNPTGSTTYSADLLDTQLNNKFVDWGACDATNHSYTKWVVADDDSMNLRVFDGDTATNQQDPSWYADNNGSLNVTVVAHKI